MPTPNLIVPMSADAFASFAGLIGEALGRGVARGLGASLTGAARGATFNGESTRKRGRPAKPVYEVAPAAIRCKAEGCVRASRSKGLCSAHYQAARRKKLARA